MELQELLLFIEQEERRLRKTYPQLKTREMRMLIHTVKLSEEVGELCEEVLAASSVQRKKKLAARTPTTSTRALEEEFADVIITTLIFGQSLGIDIEAALTEKMKTLRHRSST